MKIHHIGIITHNIKSDAEIYVKLGYSACGGIVADMNQHNRILFLQNEISGELIELIEPLDENSSVKNFPTGYAHICYEVGDLDAHIKDFRAKRLGTVFTGKIKAPAIGDRHVVFAFLKNKTIVEFLELKEERGKGKLKVEN